MISAAMVKELRERTGAGMMDCKKALTETNGDMEAAIDFLREKDTPRPGIQRAEREKHRRIAGKARRLGVGEFEIGKMGIDCGRHVFFRHASGEVGGVMPAVAGEVGDGLGGSEEVPHGRASSLPPYSINLR